MKKLGAIDVKQTTIAWMGNLPVLNEQVLKSASWYMRRAILVSSRGTDGLDAIGPQ